jgi:lipoprotein-anchoring transpeptidase ErfK/SrfK
VRSRPFILVVTLLVALVVLGGVVYGYDRSQSGQIAKGVSVGGIDLGGLTRAQAKAKLERRILAPLEQPIVVHNGDKTWKLGAREAQINADLGAMVDQALASSRQGDLLSRSVREITGGKLNESLRPTVRFSDRAIVRLVDRVRRAIERPAKDATVHIGPSGIGKVPSHAGLSVDSSGLHRQIRAAIVSPTAGRSFVARTRQTQPKVTTADLAQKYNTVIIVDRKAFRLTLYKALKVKKTYPIAVGRVGLETPAGLYNIQDKVVNPAWHVPDSAWAGKLAGKVIAADDPANPIKARWMGIYDGAGIHGTTDDSSIGSAASHGCIRMHIPDVIELYPQVPIGTPVYIA